jgi:hypothetical protein
MVCLPGRLEMASACFDRLDGNIGMNWLKKLLKAFARGLGNLSPDCREAARLQSNALDVKLSFGQRFGLRIHLLICKWCRRYGTQIRFLRKAALEHHEKLTEASSQKLPDDARKRIKEKLQNQ